jgi:hypothetical protein
MQEETAQRWQTQANCCKSCYIKECTARTSAVAPAVAWSSRQASRLGKQQGRQHAQLACSNRLPNCHRTKCCCPHIHCMNTWQVYYFQLCVRHSCPRQGLVKPRLQCWRHSHPDMGGVSLRIHLSTSHEIRHHAKDCVEQQASTSTPTSVACPVSQCLRHAVSTDMDMLISILTCCSSEGYWPSSSETHQPCQTLSRKV